VNGALDKLAAYLGTRREALAMLASAPFRDTGAERRPSSGFVPSCGTRNFRRKEHCNDP
jgi:hypothetical protein